MTKELQRHLDEITFDLFVDCGCHLRETVAQSGLAASTVRARVRRHSRRLSEQEQATHECDGECLGCDDMDICRQ